MESTSSKQPKHPRAAFIHSAQIEKYHYPPDCPFNCDRAGMTRQILASMGLLCGNGRFQLAPISPDRQELLTFHTAGYLDTLQNAPLERFNLEWSRMGIGTPDCPIFDKMFDYAALACGGTLAGAKAILAGEFDVAFNPSGGYHHAHPNSASGFCYINDVAIACMHLAAGGRRVLFLDVDAHHCDGVQEAFYGRGDIMTVSFHESGTTLFPGTGFENEIGVGGGVGYSANVPLPVGVYDEAFLRAFDAIAMPLIAAFGPDVIVLELGMDALADDPLTHLSLTNNAHVEVIERVMDFALPVLATGGGGYNIHNTARGWALAWVALSGQNIQGDAADLKDARLPPDDRLKEMVDSAIDETIEKIKTNLFPHHGL